MPDVETVQEAETPADALVTECAFVAYKDSNGHWVATADFDKQIVSSRQATFEDFTHAASTIERDVLVQLTAAKTMQFQQMIVEQAAERAKTMQMMKDANVPGADKLFVP